MRTKTRERKHNLRNNQRDEYRSMEGIDHRQDRSTWING